METVRIDFSVPQGKVKPLHCVNNGPWGSRGNGNSISYGEAGIPYARNHDAAFCASYGGHRSVDVAFIFPNFDADANAPESYDFACTDKYVAETYAVGTKMFYRLGSKIEHGIKKYNTIPPTDYMKWAEICEHIIRHYTEGWNNGFKYDMEYWEIWNEPDGHAACWQGSDEQFFQFFITVAHHLKTKFPHLKIGGPAVSHGTMEWNEKFLKRISDINGVRTPLDFFSWHGYTSNPETYSVDARHIRAILDKTGYPEAESILNEWNYVSGWSGEEWEKTVHAISSVKGAAFNASAMCVAQREDIDMLMYYDARPRTVFNGMFGIMGDPKKGYYPFKMFNTLYKMGNSVKVSVDTGITGRKINAVAAKDENRNACVMVTYFSDEDAAKAENAAIELAGFAGKNGVLANMYILDGERNAELFRTEKSYAEVYTPIIKMEPNTVIFIELSQI